MIVKPDAENLLAQATSAAKKGPAPVHLWNPPFCGDLDMVIKRDGTWFYEGTPIGRERMVRLFASILKREGDDYFLVTPVEKVGIQVEDVPFIALDVEAQGSGTDQTLTFTTNMLETITATTDHPLRVAIDADGEPAPYVMVRRGMEARIDRKTFYRLVDLGQDHNDWFGVWSGGTFFPIIKAAALR